MRQTNGSGHHKKDDLFLSCKIYIHTVIILPLIEKTKHFGNKKGATSAAPTPDTELSNLHAS